MYTGYQELKLNDQELNILYMTNKLSNYSFNENEYAIIQNSDGETIDYRCFQNGELRKVNFPQITCEYSKTIKPKNPQQYCAMDMLDDRTSKVKILRGVYGSGKDFLMLYKALELIEKGLFQKIIFVRPNIGVAGIPDIGALPGDEFEKLAWTLAPLYDKVGGEFGVRQLIENEIIETVPLGFIRGRSFDNSIIYVCEAQNSTTEIAKLLIGRVGENSELWLNGDSHQCDKRMFEQDNGLTKMVDKLSGIKLFGYVYLPTTERSEVARLADLLDN